MSVTRLPPSLTGVSPLRTLALNFNIFIHHIQIETLLVRADGLGVWANCLEDSLSGPASQFLSSEAQVEREEMTKAHAPGTWQHTAVSSLKAALDELEIDAEPVPRRTDLKRWFRLFATLRNATRGHGATRPAESGRAATHLLQSIETIYGNLYLFRRPWVYLYRNLSGKFRVTRFRNDAVEFDYLKREPTHSFSNGVYIHFGVPMQVPLIESDPELSDFFLPNGGFSDKKYELLSYATDNRRSGDSSNFHTPPEVPRSETEPFGELLARGNCFSNAPEPTEGYIPRPALETELYELLMDDRHRVVTLQGAGGVGKTSSAL